MLVTVYIPSKNRLELLARAVSSVVNQTYESGELLIVNDGSTDGTREFLDDLVSRDSRIRIIQRESSSGAPYCRNLAIRSASGDFVTGLDDDDWFHPNRLTALVEYWRLLAKSGETFSCIYTQEVYVRGDERSMSRKPDSVYADDLYFHNLVGNQVFARKEAYLEAGLFDESMPAWQDLDMFIRLLTKLGPGRLLDDALYFTSHEERPDRISVGSKDRISSAYRKLLAKSTCKPAVVKQGLFLQTFGPLYGRKPGLLDLPEFFRYGVHPKNMRALLGIYLRAGDVRHNRRQRVT